MNTKMETKMETNGNYKEEIIATRVGGLGSSDAGMVAHTGRTGSMNYQAQIRLGQMLGQCDRPQFRTEAMKLGDEIENRMFDIVKSKYPGAVSNPYYRHEGLSSEHGFDVFSHIDFEVETEDELIWFECKATKADTRDTMARYTEQLAWHWMVGQEKADSAGKAFSLFLVHYRTEVTDGFDADNISIRRIAQEEVRGCVPFIREGLGIIRNAIAAGFTFRPKTELDASDLPEPVRRDMDVICEYVRQMVLAEMELDKFKARMLPIMEANGVSSIRNDFFRISVRDAYVRTDFDKDKFRSEHPEMYDRYIKKTNVKSSISIKTN